MNFSLNASYLLLLLFFSSSPLFKKIVLDLISKHHFRFNFVDNFRTFFQRDILKRYKKLSLYLFFKRCVSKKHSLYCSTAYKKPCFCYKYKIYLHFCLMCHYLKLTLNLNFPFFSSTILKGKIFQFKSNNTSFNIFHFLWKFFEKIIYVAVTSHCSFSLVRLRLRKKLNIETFMSPSFKNWIICFLILFYQINKKNKTTVISTNFTKFFFVIKLSLYCSGSLVIIINQLKKFLVSSSQVEFPSLSFKYNPYNLSLSYQLVWKYSSWKISRMFFGIVTQKATFLLLFSVYKKPKIFNF